jgi:enoyl-CoA hydratase/carnithine racemase
MSDNGKGAVYTERRGSIVSVVLNRPEKLNAVTAGMIRALHDALAMSQRDPDAAVIMLRGEGRAFCSGDDVSELAGASSDPIQQTELVNVLQGVTRHIMLGPKPVIAVVQGWAVGAAFSWLLNCDLSVCGRSARAFFPEVKWGVSPTGGATALAPRMLGAAAGREAFYLSRRFGATELVDLGAVTRLAPDGGELESATAMAEEVALLPAFALRGVKKLTNQAIVGELDSLLAAEAALAVATSAREEVGRRLSGLKPSGTSS